MLISDHAYIQPFEGLLAAAVFDFRDRDVPLNAIPVDTVIKALRARSLES